MLYLNCEDIFLGNIIINILNQKKIEIHQDQRNNYLSQLIIKKKNKSIFLEINEKKTVLELPTSHEVFFNCIKKLLNNIKIRMKEFDYYPYQQTIIMNHKKIYLKNIHNQILLKLVLHIEKGINKELLYQYIWPNEKVISINKLDSHLTNLKNLLLSEIGFLLNFNSNNKNIKLIMN